MKTYICTSRQDGSVYTCQAENKEDLLENYDISEEYFEIVEQQAA